MTPPILIYRFGHFIHNLGLVRTAKVISWFNRFLFAVWIPSSAKIGKNFKLGYWGLGVVIHSNSIIGDNCVIAQNVTIGRKNGDKAVPIIGNNVYVATGTVIFGEITVGYNVIIGANSVVNRSIPSNSVVAGNPARVIKENI